MVKKFEDAITMLILLVCMGVLVFLLSGCYTANKATKQVVKAQVHYPEVLAGICGDLYPPKEYRKDSIIYKPGAVVTIPGKTVYVDCNSDSNKGKSNVPIDCPPSTMQIDTVYSKSEIQVENTAKVTALELQQGKLQRSYDRLDVKATWYLWWAIAATAGLVAGAALKYFRIL